MGIKSRAFGAEIPVRVKKKLEARQNASALKVNPLETVQKSRYSDDADKDADNLTYGDLLNNQFDGIADLSSRKPFARLWTAINIKEVVKGTVDGVKYPKKKHQYQDSGDSEEDIMKKIESDLANNPNLYFNSVKKEVNLLEDTMNKPACYIIGNNQLNVLQNERELDSIQKESLSDTYNYYDIFPPELSDGPTDGSKQLHHHNAPAGIIKVSSETQGSFGQTIKTTVEFKVFSFRDFERIYSRYFLRPGAQVFLDMGWNNITDLYNPSDLLENNID